MAELQFVKGISFKTYQTKTGNEFIKFSIDIEKIFENPVKNEKYINCILNRSKTKGTLYATIDDWEPNKQQTSNNDSIVNFGTIDEDEIPF